MKARAFDKKADFSDTIARGVRVFREDVVAIHESSVELGSGLRLEADALVYATGWTCDLSYFETPLLAKLILPMAEAEEDLDEKSQRLWRTLD
jgi:hypothetical protein